jgi:hypothetical protein
MMERDLTRPFETIECALEFMTLLDGVVVEVSADLQAKLQVSVTERYKNGLTLASYKVQQLSSHVQKSRRILNDLALIRRVLVANSSPSMNGELHPKDEQSASQSVELGRLDDAIARASSLPDQRKKSHATT